MGVVPANTVVYTLMTRPRRSSGTVSWMMVFVVAPMATVDQPTMPMSSTLTGSIVEMPTTRDGHARAGTHPRTRDPASPAHRTPATGR